jgi:hypothetical protein
MATVAARKARSAAMRSQSGVTSAALSVTT